MPDALLCGIKADAGLFQLFAVHDQIAQPVGGFDLHRNVQLLRELLCRVHHIFRIGAAKVVHAAGQAQCRSKVCDHLSDIGHAPAVVGRKGHRRPMQGGAQKVQRQVAPDGHAQEGYKIKVAERVAPEREEWGWDTGWGFFSDDDDEIEDDENGGFYDIRDICRIDPTVVPLLSLPYGTCMEKDETGEWIEIEDDETERS